MLRAVVANRAQTAGKGQGTLLGREQRGGGADDGNGDEQEAKPQVGQQLSNCFTCHSSPFLGPRSAAPRSEPAEIIHPAGCFRSKAAAAEKRDAANENGGPYATRTRALTHTVATFD
jgi:hypothetical protein